MVLVASVKRLQWRFLKRGVNIATFLWLVYYLYDNHYRPSLGSLTKKVCFPISSLGVGGSSIHRPHKGLPMLNIGQNNGQRPEDFVGATFPQDRLRRREMGPQALVECSDLDWREGFISRAHVLKRLILVQRCNSDGPSQKSLFEL